MFKVLNEVCTPTKATEHSACIDLYSREDVVIGAGETVKIPLGVSISKDEMPIYLQNNLHRHYLQLEPRSSIRAKGLQAGTGIVDLDYEDEIMLILHNPINLDFVESIACQEVLVSLDGRDRKMPTTENAEVTIQKGQKIAQIMLCEHKSYLFGIESKTKRVGGFGSTGK